ncbi:dihydrolipoyllysine-residue succinyltransferase [Thioalkalivibrio sp. HK1]|uniref:dihydrolipoyllysine-residue succinyltransferase n=1 Tax=Thioalkalivibrio sp. HK1 TaxID=1469245 RepID=UPI00046F2793|nr:dihydrolipoyllysine-residue succinyltransferase [Thioalkalivibrio sp. HK1]
MSIEVKVPTLAESIPDATLLDWRRQPGDDVEQDDILIELETDKVVLEVPAPISGKLVEVLRQKGDIVQSGEVLARIQSEEERAHRSDDGTDALADDAHAIDAAATPAPSAAAPATQTEKHPQTPPLSPAVRRIVGEHDLDPARIEGSGPNGRITKADALAEVEAGAADPMPETPTHRTITTPAPAAAAAPVSDPVAASDPAPDPDPAPTPTPAAQAKSAERESPAPASPPPAASERTDSRNERREPMSRLRRRVAERLLDAQRSSAILTTFNEIDMSGVLALRSRYKEDFEKRHGSRLGFMSFFAKAAVMALERFPAVNAYIEGGDIVYHDYCDIGIAVSSPRGLVVPILRNVERMSFADIESTITEFGRRAGDGSLSIDDMSGGTFTISNGGIFGSMMSTPILNPPQSGILGMHKIMERAMVVEGEIVVRPMMYIALSYDHRIIDGREAVQFLVCVKEAIEDPSRLLLNA